MVESLAVSVSLPNMTPLHLRLDWTNYGFWRAQVLATVRAHGFEDLLSGAHVPTQFLPSPVPSTSSDPNSILSPAYLTWLRRDQFVFSWLLSSITESMLGYVNRCSTAAELWSVFAQLFQSHSKARAMQLRFLFQTTKKGDLSIDDFVLKMCGLAEQLHAIGQSISNEDLILYVLGDLGAEYESVVVNLTSCLTILLFMDSICLADA